VRRARTSRRTFYEHFDDREDCLLALFDVVSERLVAAITEAATADGTWEERVDRALGAYLGALAAEPELARCCIEEIPATGPAGRARVRAMNRRWGAALIALVDEARAHDPALEPLSPEAATVITGGFRDLVLTALEDDRDLIDLRAVGAELLRRIVAPARVTGPSGGRAG